jgi:hypothetical protein
MKGDVDNPNELEDKTESSHATARPIRRAPCWLADSISERTPWISGALCVPSLEGHVGPGSSSEHAGEGPTSCTISPSMERRETNTENRGRSIRGREIPSLLTRGPLRWFRRRPPCIERTAVHTEEGVPENRRDEILENEIPLTIGVPVHGIFVD